MIYKLEVFYNFANDFAFELDSDTAGLLDGDFTLAGELYQDITQYLRSVSIRRGRSNIYGYNSAGQLNIELNNFGREFDPTITTSPVYGMVVPKSRVRLTINDEVQFVGIIQDWDLTFAPAGVSIAAFDALDEFADWANRTLPAYTPASLQTTSEAINEALEQIGVFETPPEPSGTIMTDQAVQAGTNALQYVQKLATSDYGSLYIKKAGGWDYAPFSRRITGLISLRIAADVNKPISIATVEYGTENLYNKVEITFADTGETVTASDSASIAKYGEFELNDSGSLISGDVFGVYGGVKAQELIELFSEPELRIDSIQLNIGEYNSTAQDEVLGLELGDKVVVVYDPDDSGREIVRVSRIIGIRHEINPNEHYVTFNFESSSSTPFVLNEITLGRLDAGNYLERTFDFSI